MIARFDTIAIKVTVIRKGYTTVITHLSTGSVVVGVDNGMSVGK